MSTSAPQSGAPCLGDPSRPEPNVPHMWMPSSQGRIVLTVLGFAGGIFLSGFAVDVFLVSQRWLLPTYVALIINATFAVLAAALLYRLLSYNRDKRSRILERLETIDEMNHHIRNALQVIAFNAHRSSNESELAEIKQAVNRIQWALREILPKVEPEFAAFEGSAKHKNVGE